MSGEAEEQLWFRYNATDTLVRCTDHLRAMSRMCNGWFCDPLIMWDMGKVEGPMSVVRPPVIARTLCWVLLREVIDARYHHGSLVSFSCSLTAMAATYTHHSCVRVVP